MKIFKKTYFCLINDKRSLMYLILIIALAFSACSRPEAKQNENTALASSPSLNRVASEKFIIDTKESILTWYGSMLITSKGSHTGNINFSKGELLTEKGGKLVGGIVDVAMNTIADERGGTKNNLVDHLKSADFFEVEKFPISTFTVIMVTPAKDKTVNVTGNLTIKGLTHIVTFPAIIEVNDSILKADGKLSINRTQWDIRYKSRAFGLALADDLISDSIEFEMKIVARK